ncbi:hypothetical protein B842_03220 [Corynebacterium humireducens NBRC 106098 = DSM 45392]|uniref:Uncharacterized protein n=1 Tax=Corynebacterium humireducens NBRC 106098 = DSM 45392 TaxID=1223515 RepID=A0A0B5D5X7_9CORY|nr:hypothetical protein B842_03220 [Corynebacterium humireducens NBRC 106098 = DSM 45392]
MPIEYLPAPVQPWARRLRGWLLSDASALLVLAYSAWGHAAAYQWIHTQVTHPAEAYFGFHVWALVWAGVGVLALAGAVWHRHLVATLATGAVVGIHALWAASHLGGALVGDFARGYVGFSVYSSLVLLTFWSLWRGARTEIQIRPIEGEHSAGRARARS